MKEHLREIRSLRQRLEDSIQTNDRLRQQLEERLARTATEKGNTQIFLLIMSYTLYWSWHVFTSKWWDSSVPVFPPGAPTNIYIQGLDSVGQLSSEIRLLKEENISLQNQLKQATRGKIRFSLTQPETKTVEETLTR